MLKKITEAMKDLVTEANFDCSTTGISVQAMVRPPPRPCPFTAPPIVKLLHAPSASPTSIIASARLKLHALGAGLQPRVARGAAAAR